MKSLKKKRGFGKTKFAASMMKDEGAEKPVRKESMYMAVAGVTKTAVGECVG